MGEPLVITTSLQTAKDILKIIKDPELLSWEGGSHVIDVLSKWLPRKGFEILPKFLDTNYKPGTIGDKGDELIISIRGCHLRSVDGQESQPIWDARVLRLPQMREELRKILEEQILDMSFEQEVAKELKGIFGDINRPIDKKILEDDNKNLQDLARILMKLAECIDQVIINRGKEHGPPFVELEFYIPRA